MNEENTKRYATSSKFRIALDPQKTTVLYEGQISANTHCNKRFGIYIARYFNTKHISD